MFLKARQWLRMMLLALAVQIGTLAKVGPRKGYGYKYGNQGKLRQVESNFKQEVDASLRGQSGLPLDDLSKYRLGLTGKFEPATNLATVNLFGHSNIEELQAAASRAPCCG